MFKSRIERYADAEARIGRSDLGEREDPPMTLAEFQALQRQHRSLARRLGLDPDAEDDAE